MKPLRGAPTLGPRASQVRDLALAGKTNREIALEMYITVNTVKRHRDAIREYYGLHGTTWLSVLAWQLWQGKDGQ